MDTRLRLPLGYPLGRAAGPGDDFVVRCADRFVVLGDSLYRSWWDARWPSRGSAGVDESDHAELLRLGLLVGGDDLFACLPVGLGIGRGQEPDGLFAISDHRLEPLCRVDALTYAIWAAASGRATLTDLLENFIVAQGYDREQFRARLLVVVQELMSSVVLFLDEA
jgi:hypothetical protein